MFSTKKDDKQNKLGNQNFTCTGISVNEDLDFSEFAKCVARHNERAKNPNNNLKPFVLYK